MRLRSVFRASSEYSPRTLLMLRIIGWLGIIALVLEIAHDRHLLRF